MQITLTFEEQKKFDEALIQAVLIQMAEEGIIRHPESYFAGNSSDL